MDRGKHLTAKTFTTTNAPQAPLPDMMGSYLYYFDIFIQRNNFTGRERSFLVDVKSLMKVAHRPGEPGSPLLSAVLALGSMQMHNLSVDAKRHVSLRFALESYAQSISGLRDAVSSISGHMDVPTRAGILWTTFFLGLFEVSLTRGFIHPCTHD